jgi:class III poly(R)-hydroxyalkanoic acid synthase PhaE subunit
MRSQDRVGFGIPGVDASEAAEQAERLWRTWSDALRSVASGDSAPSQDLWRGALDRWSELAGAAMGGSGQRDAPQRDPFDRFSRQARQWLGAMQDVAGQFVGKAASAEEIVDAWRQAMGSTGNNPFGAMFAQMPGRGHAGFDQWYEQIAPFLSMPLSSAGLGTGFGDTGEFAHRLIGGFRDEGREWLRMPNFGPAREHQERWRVLAQAQLDLQEANDDYNAMLAQAGRDAFDRFERKLAEHCEPGRRLQSARALFDAWIDAAEDAYAEIALSPEFRAKYAALVNAQMRVRAGVQREVETLGGQLGMPTRTEVDSAHRKIAELERELRRMRKAIESSSVVPKRAAPANAQAEAHAMRDESKSAKEKPAKAKPSAAASKGKARATAERPKAVKTSRAPARVAAKRGAKPSIATLMPEAPKPLKRDKASKPSTRKR